PPPASTPPSPTTAWAPNEAPDVEPGETPVTTSASPAPAANQGGAGNPKDPAIPASAPVSGAGVTVASPDTVLPTPEGPAAGAATPLSAPTMLAPIVVPGQRRGP